MTITAQSIILDAQTTLQDPNGTRWTATELVRHLNRSQRDIHVARQDTTATTASVSLSAGFRQTIPANAASLIDIPCNTNGAAITKISKLQLDAVMPGWRTGTQRSAVKHFMYELTHPRQFEVYPPVLANVLVDLEYSAYPTDVGAPSGDGKSYTTVSGNISLGDHWTTALLSMVLHYAYAKDAEYGGNKALSDSYLQKAEALLGTQVQSTASVAPKS